jgi:hypothetical protein
MVLELCPLLYKDFHYGFQLCKYQPYEEHSQKTKFQFKALSGRPPLQFLNTATDLWSIVTSVRKWYYTTLNGIQFFLVILAQILRNKNNEELIWSDPEEAFSAKCESRLDENNEAEVITSTWAEAYINLVRPHPRNPDGVNHFSWSLVDCGSPHVNKNSTPTTVLHLFLAEEIRLLVAESNILNNTTNT